MIGLLVSIASLHPLPYVHGATNIGLHSYCKAATVLVSSKCTRVAKIGDHYTQNSSSTLQIACRFHLRSALSRELIVLHSPEPRGYILDPPARIWRKGQRHLVRILRGLWDSWVKAHCRMPFCSKCHAGPFGQYGRNGYLPITPGNTFDLISVVFALTFLSIEQTSRIALKNEMASLQILRD